MKFNKTLDKTVLNDIENNIPVLLLGEVGIGKSSWIENLANNHLNTKCFTLACNQLAEKADLTGQRLMPKEDGGFTTMFFPHKTIDDAIDYANSHPGESPILFLDEINRTTTDTTSALLSLATQREIGNSKLPINLTIVSAGNDKGNINVLDEASLTRFSIYTVEPDLETYLSVNPELNKRIIDVLREKPSLIFCKQLPALVDFSDENEDEYIEEDFSDIDGMNQLTTPRTITALSRWLNRFKDEELKDLLMDETIKNNITTTALQECINAKTGDTEFSRILYNNLVQELTVINTNKPHMIIIKPVMFDKLKNFDNINSLEKYINSLDNDTKASCLLYALHDTDNNTNIINAIATVMTVLPSDFVAKMFEAKNADILDETNVQTYFETNSPIATSIAQLFNN